MKRKRRLLHTSVFSFGIIGITHMFSPPVVGEPLPENLLVLIFGGFLMGLSSLMRRFLQ